VFPYTRVGYNSTALLDEIILCLRRDTGKYMSRSAMLRAIIAAVLPFYQNGIWANLPRRYNIRFQRASEAINTVP
jgi:hypothetical protein